MTPTTVDGLLALGAAIGPLAIRAAHPRKSNLAWAAVGDSVLGMFSTVVVWRLMLAFGLVTPELVQAATATWVATVAFGASFGGVCTVIVQLLAVRFKDRVARLIRQAMPAEDDTPVPTRRYMDNPSAPRRRKEDGL